MPTHRHAVQSSTHRAGELPPPQADNCSSTMHGCLCSDCRATATKHSEEMQHQHQLSTICMMCLTTLVGQHACMHAGLRHFPCLHGTQCAAAATWQCTLAFWIRCRCRQPTDMRIVCMPSAAKAASLIMACCCAACSSQQLSYSGHATQRSDAHTYARTAALSKLLLSQYN